MHACIVLACTHCQTNASCPDSNLHDCVQNVHSATDVQMHTFHISLLTHLQPKINTWWTQLLFHSYYLCVLVFSFLSLSWGGDACLAASTFPFLLWPVPRCICRGSSLSLQKAQRKKIRKLALMKTRSTVSFPVSLSLFLSHPHPTHPPLFAMNLERRERRRIKFNSNQLSAEPDDRALKCKCACVSFSLSYSASSPALLFIFYERRGEACSLTFCLLVWQVLLPLNDLSFLFFSHENEFLWALKLTNI